MQNLNTCHARRLTSLDITKVYACVFRPVKSTMRMLFKQINLALIKENVHRGALL